MRRFTRSAPSVAIVALVARLLLLLGPAAGPQATVARAQGATPAAGPPEQEGVTFDLVSVAPGITLPSPADLLVVRIGLDPGAVSPFDANDPNGGVLLVESGAIAVRVEAAWTVTRGAGIGAAMATVEATGDMTAAVETFAAGEEATLEAGDAAYIPGNVDGELRNDGQDRAVGLAFLVGPSAGAMGEATPAA